MAKQNRKNAINYDSNYTTEAPFCQIVYVSKVAAYFEILQTKLNE